MKISIIDNKLVSNNKQGNLAAVSKVIEFDDLKTFAGLCLKYHICCGIFNENIRKLDHFKEIYFLQFDFDDGTDIDSVKNSFPLENMIILASKSHLVDKDDGKGVIPRFHVFLPLKTPITDAGFYTYLVKYLAKRQNISIDRRAIDSTRYFFKHSKFLYGKVSGENLDPTEYYDNYTKEKELQERKNREHEEKLLNMNRNSDLTNNERIEAAKILIALKVGDAVQKQEGNKNTFRATCFAVRCGLTESEIYQVLDWYNDNFCKPKWHKKDFENKVKYAKMRVEFADYFLPGYIRKVLNDANFERAFK